MKKCIIFILCFSIGVFAQEKTNKPQQTQQTKQNDPEYEEFKKWKESQNSAEMQKDFEDYKAWKQKDKTNDSEAPKFHIYGLGGGGVSTTEFDRGNNTLGKIGVEYRPNKYFGFGGGIQSQNITLNPKDSSSPLITLLLLPTLLGGSGSSSTSGSATNFLNLLLITSLAAPAGYSYNLALLAIDMNFHMRGDKTVDPFLGISALGGSCVGTIQCSAYGGEFRLGTNINIGNYFFIIQAQAQQFNVNESGIGITKVNNGIGSIGFGVRL